MFLYVVLLLVAFLLLSQFGSVTFHHCFFFMMDDQLGDTVMQEGLEDQEFLARRELLLFGERIIFVLDDDSEEFMSEWEPGSGKSRLDAATDAIRLIIRRKLNATLKSTFAIASYNSTSQVTWREGFTSDFQRLDESLTHFTSLLSSSQRLGHGGGGGGVRLADIFTQLVDLSTSVVVAQGSCTSTTSPEIKPETDPGTHTESDADIFRDADTDIAPRVLTRFVFVYSRSEEVPVYSSPRPFFPPPTSRTHFLDCLFLHHKLATHRECAAACQDTLNVLSLIQRGDPDDEDGEPEEEEEEENNYLFETHASSMRLMTFAALLCSHPAHREEQTDMLGKFNVNDASLRGIREVDEQSRLDEVARKASKSNKHAPKGRQQTAPLATSTATVLSSSTGTGTAAGASSSPSSSSSSSGPKNSTSSSLSGAADTVKNMFGMGFGSNKSKKNNDEKSTVNTHTYNDNHHSSY